jgi:hypothetical protein
MGPRTMTAQRRSVDRCGGPAAVPSVFVATDGEEATHLSKLIVHEAMTINGAFESPAPDTWLELDNHSSTPGLRSSCWRTR